MTVKAPMCREKWRNRDREKNRICNQLWPRLGLVVDQLLRDGSGPERQQMGTQMTLLEITQYGHFAHLDDPKMILVIT